MLMIGEGMRLQRHSSPPFHCQDYEWIVSMTSLNTKRVRTEEGKICKTRMCRAERGLAEPAF